MSDPQQTISFRRSDSRDDLPVYDAGPFGDQTMPADGTAGLVSLGFIWSALERQRRVWCALAVVGLVIGCGLAVVKPPPHSATTTVLINNPGDILGSQLQTDIALVESTPVAAAVVAQLGIQQTPLNFLATYTVKQVTTQVISITTKGPDNDAAVRRASAIAAQFLAFRAKYLQDQLQQTQANLKQQVSQAQQHLDSINSQITQVKALPADTSQQAKLGNLKAQRTDAENTLAQVKQNTVGSLGQAQTTTAQMVNGSEVLSPATPAKRSVLKTAVLYAFGGLVGGLIIGMAIVAIAAITSNRLRRRDDISYAFGAPVRLSLGRLRKGRLSLDLRGKATALRNRDIGRFVEHLRNAVPARSKGDPAGLTVVAVDDAPTVARAVVALVISCAEQRRRVVLADLSAGAHAARQLGVTSPGVSSVSPEGVPIVVMVPPADEVAPIGPLRTSPPGYGQVSERLADAAAQADLVLSLVSLNPAFGGDYLRTWATDAVAVVTAGRSTATRVQAAGEMVRLAGARLDSVVVIDVDKSDETLGVPTGEHRPASAQGA